MMTKILEAFLLVALVMVLGACGDDPTPVIQQPNGSACEEDAGCESDYCLIELGDNILPGGYCTDECQWFPDGSDDCAENEICLQHGPSETFFCAVRCTSDDDCRSDEGYACVRVDLSRVCL